MNKNIAKAVNRDFSLTTEKNNYRNRVSWGLKNFKGEYFKNGDFDALQLILVRVWNGFLGWLSPAEEPRCRWHSGFWPVHCKLPCDHDGPHRYDCWDGGRIKEYRWYSQDLPGWQEGNHRINNKTWKDEQSETNHEFG